MVIPTSEQHGEGLGPLLRAMQEANDFDAGLPLEPVDRDKGRAADDQFASVFHAAGSADLGVLQEHLDLALDLVVLICGRERIVLGDVVELIEAVAIGLGEPLDDQAPPLLELRPASGLRQLARRRALSAFTVSSETH